MNEVLELKVQGSSSYDQGDHHTAAQLLTRAIHRLGQLKDASDASHAHLLSVLYCNRAAVREAQGLHVQASVDAKLAAKHDPTWAKPHVRLAAAQASLARYSQALQALASGATHVPHDRHDNQAELQAAHDVIAGAAEAHARSRAAAKRRRLEAAAAALGLDPSLAGGVGVGVGGGGGGGGDVPSGQRSGDGGLASMQGVSCSSDGNRGADVAHPPPSATPPQQHPPQAAAASSPPSADDVLELAVAVLDRAAAGRGWVPGRQPDHQRVAVTVVSGFLGSGKTTLLTRLLAPAPAPTSTAAPATASAPQAACGAAAGEGTALGLGVGTQAQPKFAVIVNDLASINVDGALVRGALPGLPGGPHPPGVAGDGGGDGGGSGGGGAEVVEMSNGCICCGLRGDLILAVAQLLAAHPGITHLLVESTGVGQPAPIADAFTATTPCGRGLADYTRLDACVTVVDAPTFHATLADPALPTPTPAPAGHTVPVSGLGGVESADPAPAAAAAAPALELDPQDARPLAELLVDQVECADIILINKCDLMGGPHGAYGGGDSRGGDSGGVGDVEAALSALNPRARILRTVRCRCDSAAILDTHLFHPEATLQGARWQQELVGGHTHTGQEPFACPSATASHGPSSDEQQGAVGGGAQGHLSNDGGESESGSEDHIPETETYAISSAVFEARAPFHPERLWAWLAATAPTSVATAMGAGGCGAGCDHHHHHHHAHQQHGHQHESEPGPSSAQPQVTAPGEAATSNSKEAAAAVPAAMPPPSFIPPMPTVTGKDTSLQPPAATAPPHPPSSHPPLRLLRAKGFLWVASHPSVAWEWGVAGAAGGVRAYGQWLAGVLPRHAWPTPGVREGWDDRWGDRRQSLVLIGQHLQGDVIKAQLAGCLMREEELDGGEEAWEGVEGAQQWQALLGDEPEEMDGRVPPDMMGE